ncbi:MAG: DUF2334 domain-containing protein [archaeon]
MGKIFLDIHMEGEYQNADILKSLRDNQIYCALSFIPQRIKGNKRGCYGEELKRIAMEMFNLGLTILGQYGNHHRYIYDSKHPIADGTHENFCFYDKISKQEQQGIIEKGRKILFSEFGVNPNLYVPPNHLSKKYTREILDNSGFRYLAERAVINHDPYERGNIIVLPEGLFKGESPIKYVHYSELTPEIIKELKFQTTGFSEIVPKEVGRIEQALNTGIVKLIKQLEYWLTTC